MQDYRNKYFIEHKLNIRSKKKAHSAHQVTNVNKCPQISSSTIVSPDITKHLEVVQSSAATDTHVKRIAFLSQDN